ncbi:MAG TPA: hypothetical protein VF175_13075 [Lacipirellula sp.]
MSNAVSPPALRVSLREFLVVFSAFAVGFTALAFANSWWLAAVSGVTLLAVIAAAVISLVDRGKRQASAIGFAVSAVCYLPLFLQGREADPFTGRLPTTQMLQPIFLAVREQSYVNSRTREIVKETEIPRGAPVEGKGGFPTYGRRAFSGGYFLRADSIPALEHFMPVGHCLWALLLGYVGAKFAGWVYVRRLREQESQVAAG